MIPQHLKEKVQGLPMKPGIYKFLDIDGRIIYIGKSKGLRSRVMSYFNTQHEWNKLKRLVFNIQDIEHIATDTHLEAKILECVLIKKHKPMYNAQFTKDKNYRYIIIQDNPMKPIAVAPEREGQSSFGPFRSKGILSDAIMALENLFPIVKSDQAFNYSFKVFPLKLDEEAFKENKGSLIEIFTNNHAMKEFLRSLEDNMKVASAQFQFELASYYKNLLNSFNYIYRCQLMIAPEVGNSVIMGEGLEEGYKLFYIAEDNLILKERLMALDKDRLLSFMERAEGIKKIYKGINEKRNLDFKFIIRSEILNEDNKAFIHLKDDYNIEDFIEKLKAP